LAAFRFHQTSTDLQITSLEIVLNKHTMIMAYMPDESQCLATVIQYLYF